MLCHPWLPPVSDVINQVLFEHEAPSLDDVEQGLLEGSCIHTEPHIKHSGTLNKGDNHKPTFHLSPFNPSSLMSANSCSTTF